MAKDEKLTQEQKRKIEAVVKKWMPSRWQRQKSKILSPLTSIRAGVDGGINGALCFLLPDLLFTGGIGTTTMAGAAIFGSIGMTVGGVAPFLNVFQFKSKQGQEVMGAYATVKTLQKMEAKLDVLFNQASKCNDLHERNKIKREMIGICRDAEVLKPAYKIIENTPDTKGAKKLVFKFSEVTAKKTPLKSNDNHNTDKDVKKAVRAKPKKFGA